MLFTRVGGEGYTLSQEMPDDCGMQSNEIGNNSCSKYYSGINRDL